MHNTEETKIGNGRGYYYNRELSKILGIRNKETIRLLKRYLGIGNFTYERELNSLKEVVAEIREEYGVVTVRTLSYYADSALEHKSERYTRDELSYIFGISITAVDEIRKTFRFKKAIYENECKRFEKIVKAIEKASNGKVTTGTIARFVQTVDFSKY